jgi:hypothetical protein
MKKSDKIWWKEKQRHLEIHPKNRFGEPWDFSNSVRDQK